MISASPVNRRAQRHQTTREEILHAGWELARAEGVGGISMRDLAARVGMRQPSLYTYFPSKNAIYDAMFAQGWQALADETGRLALPTTPLAMLRVVAHTFVNFCLADVARFQLMCERPIPGFQPSPGSYVPAETCAAMFRIQLERFQINAPNVVDLWTALLTGLVNQQVANDPGGDRWTKLIDEAVDMFYNYVTHSGGPR